MKIKHDVLQIQTILDLDLYIELGFIHVLIITQSIHRIFHTSESFFVSEYGYDTSRRMEKDNEDIYVQE